MKLKMHENSLFAILLRKPWWVSGLVALAVFGLLRLFLSSDLAAFAATPFALICAYVGWRQLRAPGAGRIGATLARLRAMSWDDFSRALEAAYQRDGYAVSRLGGADADFELVQGTRHTLVACKRWKAMRTGVEPLRDLESARRAREAHECVYIATGEITAQARAFAAEKGIRLLHGVDLATLVR